MSALAWSAVAVAGLVSLLSPFPLRQILSRLGAFDVPNHRSSHSKPTVRGGGLGPLLGLVSGALVMVGIGADGRTTTFVSIILAAVLMSCVGLVEDVKGLRALLRATLQFAVGAGVAVALGLATAGWYWVALAALFFAANVNFTNFMDGINGISGLHGLVAGLTYAVLGMLTGLVWLQITGLMVAAVFLAFLPWNLLPPGMFLGDVGSYLLGGVLGAIAVAAVAAGVNPVAALAPLSIYWADAVSTLFRRAARGERVFEAHRSHAYQRLTNTGLSHLRSAAVVTIFTIAAAAVGVLTAMSAIHWAVGAALIAVVAGIFLGIPRLRGDRLPVPSTNELEPALLPADIRPREEWSPRVWSVIGGSGFIGRAVVEHLEQHGLDVSAVPAPRLQADPQLRVGETVVGIADALPETTDLADALEDVDVVVNAAGLAAPDASASADLYGANALLPAVVAIAARRAGVGRVVHLSSAAVQGDRPELDASAEVSPFSPYSRSKALGEAAVLHLSNETNQPQRTDLVIIRATSVQGPGRATTETLRKIARSPLASVAAPGTYPTVVSSLDGLVRFTHAVGSTPQAVPAMVLQPWEGLTVTKVLELAGGRSPVLLPRWLCRFVVSTGKAAGRVVPTFAGIARRLELMWFGQAQPNVQSASFGEADQAHVRRALQGSEVPA